jgi:hypothetical protein
MNTTARSFLLLTVLSLHLLGLVACGGARSAESVRLDSATIKQTVKGEAVVIQVVIPDKQVNSAHWPVTVKEEIGHDIIVVRLETGSATSSFGRKHNEEIKRAIGKNYKILARDPEGRLYYVGEFKIE